MQAAKTCANPASSSQILSASQVAIEARLHWKERCSGAHNARKFGYLQRFGAHTVQERALVLAVSLYDWSSSSTATMSKSTFRPWIRPGFMSFSTELWYSSSINLYSYKTLYFGWTDNFWCHYDNWNPQSRCRRSVESRPTLSSKRISLQANVLDMGVARYTVTDRLTYQRRGVEIHIKQNPVFAGASSKHTASHYQLTATHTFLLLSKYCSSLNVLNGCPRRHMSIIHNYFAFLPIHMGSAKVDPWVYAAR